VRPPCHQALRLDSMFPCVLMELIPFERQNVRTSTFIRAEVQDGRIHIEKINWPVLDQFKAAPTEYKAGS
jgi:hypothetical protein